MVAYQPGQKLSRSSTLVRIVLSLIFVPIYLLMAALTCLVAGIEQILALIIGAKPPLAVMRMTDRVVCYTGQVANYLILLDSTVPFPFSPLPPASAQFTGHDQTVATSESFADAEDVTVTVLADTVHTSSFAGAEDETLLNRSADLISPAQTAFDLDVGSSEPEESEESEEFTNDETTQLNPDRDAQELLDDTVLQPAQEPAGPENKSSAAPEKETDNGTEERLSVEETDDQEVAEESDLSPTEDESDAGEGDEKPKVTG